jgi:hypothetical protein
VSFFRTHAESFLPDRDYLPVAMPTTDLQVLSVLARSRRVLRRYSTLHTVLSGDANTEALLTRDQPVVAVTGVATQQMKLGIGLTVLASLISALGGQPVGGEIAAKGARSVSFAYSEVTADRADLAAPPRQRGAVCRGRRPEGVQSGGDLP